MATSTKPEVKPEIKVDPASGSNNLADIEEFEDDIDLQIPSHNDAAWLIKLPQDVWKVWYDMYKDQPDDQPIEIGKLRVFSLKENEDQLKQRLQIRIRDLPEHVELPRNYDVKLNHNGYNNTLVFAEKDLPGHHAPRYNRHARHLNKPAPAPTGIPTKQERYGSKTGYKSAIPKQTQLAPIINHEAIAAPVEDDAFFEHLEKRWQASAHPQAAVIYQKGLDREMHPGRSTLSTFNTFNTSSKPSGARLRNGKKAPVKEKNVRMEREDLIDAIFKCFTQYRYWPLKAITTQLRQPVEAVKSVLDDVAVQIRAGDFANTWQLKPEYAAMASHKHGGEDIKDEKAETPEPGNTDDDDDDGLDDDMEDFEDVKMMGS